MREVAERTKEGGCHILEGLAENGSALVSVEDAGTGFEPDVGERMFEPFFTTKSEGPRHGTSDQLWKAIADACGRRRASRMGRPSASRSLSSRRDCLAP